MQFKHLQQHHKTGHKIPSIRDCPDLVHMDHDIDVWYHCSVNNVAYHRDEYQRKILTRFNHLASMIVWLRARDHLYARATSAEGKVYFVDEQETMEKCL